jgi:outer membrane protein OmpA-like peptidoglycan-associated protein
LPLTFAFGVVCFAAQPMQTNAQTTGGRPSVEVDNSVLDQLGPPGNLPAMLLQATPVPPQKPVVLIRPKGERGGERPTKPAGKASSGKAPRLSEPAAIHLHHIKPHAGATAPKEGVIAAKAAPAAQAADAIKPEKPVAKTSKPHGGSEGASPAPISLTPTLSQNATAVTTETLKPPPPNKDKSPVAAPLPSATAPVAPTPTAAPPTSPTPAAVTPPPVAVTPQPAPVAPPIAAAPPPPAATGATPQALVALTAQPAASEPAGSGTPPAQESLSTVGFDKDSARMPDSARDMLAHLASRMSEDATLEVQLLAYASGDEANASKARRLSLSRALAVRSFLIDQGVRKTRIEVRALGNKVPDGQADRVDIVMQKRG